MSSRHKNRQMKGAALIEMFEVLDERRYGAARLVLAKAPGEAGPQPITSLT